MGQTWKALYHPPICEDSGTPLAHMECFKDARRDQIIFYATEQDITERSDARTRSSVELKLAEGRKKTENQAAAAEEIKQMNKEARKGTYIK